jgi:DNA polymerase type B, organellar and viral
LAATSPEAKARKAKRHAERLKERMAADPAFRKAFNARKEANRKARLGLDGMKALNRSKEARRQTPDYKARVKLKREAIRNARPFVGCDGEGAKDEAGRSRYVLFRMGDRELFKDGDRLTTPELLAFILDHPSPTAILVGFFFEYDISNILRDVPADRDPLKPAIPSRLERILQVDLKAVEGDPNPYRFGGWTSLKFPGFPEIGVQYIPRNFLKVCRLERFYDRKKARYSHRAVKGSTRTIFDTQGFFQCGFLDAIRLWGIGSAHWETIKRMKDDRSTFKAATPEVRRYNAIECDLLAEMMEAFRAQCIACGMVPATWNGAGKIATTLLKAHGAITAAQLGEVTPPEVIDLAHAAYYGGRFETTWAGRLPATWEHDIGSAYPAAMLKLPCLKHGRWIKATARQLAKLDDAALFVARVRFEHPRRQFLCGLPFRSKQGRLSWPREGNGVYWSPEIRSAQRLGATIHFKGGWRFEPACDCRPYEFVETLYELRRAIGKAVRGIPIKLGLNSMYGKKAQRIGKPTFANPVEAGLITAITRAAINDAIVAAGDPRRVVMIATDGIYTVEGPIDGLNAGKGLGQWETAAVDPAKFFPNGMFIVRPGLYWPLDGAGKLTGGRKLKTRGLSPKFFEPLIPAFEGAWDRWIDAPSLFRGLPDPTLVPVVPVPIETFVGVRLALRLKDGSQACQWIKRNVECKFSWADKRAGVKRNGGALVLNSRPGSPDDHSHHYDAGAALTSSIAFEIDRMLFEAMPDYVDLGAPFSDALEADGEPA